MAIGGAQSIGSIHKARHICLVKMKQTLQHTCHLLFRCLPSASDGHFDFKRSIFVYRDVAMYGGGNGYTLRTTQFEHRLHILSEKGCFDGKFVGQIGIDDSGNAFKDVAQAEIMVSKFA